MGTRIPDTVRGRDRTGDGDGIIRRCHGLRGSPFYVREDGVESCVAVFCVMFHSRRKGFCVLLPILVLLILLVIPECKKNGEHRGRYGTSPPPTTLGRIDTLHNSNSPATHPVLPTRYAIR